MIHEALQPDCAPSRSGNPFRWQHLLGLAIATSIDALAVGFSFSLLETNLLITCVTIGLVTFLLCLPAVWFGAKLGTSVAHRAELLAALF
jgi:putative Mn2+ efflux pump MntP